MTLKLEPSRRLDLLKHAGILSVAVVLLGFGSCSKTNDKTNLVGPTPVASVAVSPGSATIATAGSVSLTATPKNASGGTLSGRVVTWSSDNTAAATVNGSGLVSGVAAGSATITATCEGKTGTSDITVSIVPVASVTVSPTSASVQEGSTTQLTATPKDAGGIPLLGRVLTWSSGNTAAATVNGSGLVSGVAAGTATITATCEGQTATSDITVTASSSSVTFVGAGDIADDGFKAEETAKLLDGIPGTVFTAGDNAYPDGAASDYTNYYEPTWGRHKARTLPCPGNHDYHTSGASGYFGYYGSSAGPAGRGYYSYDLGDWHIISLNSEIDASAGSAQEQWLRADLAASSKDCTIAYWHQPLFSSGDVHGSTNICKPLWQALQDAKAEIVICGHDHEYERFAPQTAAGVADPATGIREFVVGTGGAGLYTISATIANSEVHNTNTFGVLKLTLGSGTYSWQFIPIAGQTFTDSGSGTCHK